MRSKSDALRDYLQPYAGHVCKVTGANEHLRVFVFDASASRNVRSTISHFASPYLFERARVGRDKLVPFAVTTCDEFRDFLAISSKHRPIEPDAQEACVLFYDRNTGYVYESDGTELQPFGRSEDFCSIYDIGLY